MLPLWFLVPAALLSIITVAGNGFVIYLIVSRKRLHNPTNWIVSSLAVADFSLGAGYALNRGLLGDDQVNLRYSVASFLSAASALNLCLLTLDRYIFITKPLRYVTLITTRRVVLLIVTTWMASFLPHFILYLKTSIQTSPEDPNDDYKRFALFDFAVFEVLPMVTLAFAAARIFCIVRHQSRKMEIQMVQLRFNQGTQPSTDISTQNLRNSSMKFICVAVTVFFICYLVELVLSVLNQIIDDTELPIGVYWLISDLLYFVNSAINPVAYALFKSDIKKSLRSMCCCSGRNREVPV